MLNDINFIKSLRARVLQVRGKHNLTQKQFAERSGLSEITINKFENGKNNLTNLTISKLLHCVKELEV